MTEYLVELYVSGRDLSVVAAAAERARREAERMSSETSRVRFVRSIFVPQDETCFYLYEADGGELVREAVDRAGLRIERIVEAITPLRTDAPVQQAAARPRSCTSDHSRRRHNQ